MLTLILVSGNNLKPPHYETISGIHRPLNSLWQPFWDDFENRLSNLGGLLAMVILFLTTWASLVITYKLTNEKIAIHTFEKAKKHM